MIAKAPPEPIISSYTTEQAIKDGTLCHPYPERWKWLLITQGIRAACEQTPDDYRTYEQKLVPLLKDCIMKVQSNMRAEPPVELRNTIAGTVWIVPNEKGGFTCLLPEEY